MEKHEKSLDGCPITFINVSCLESIVLGKHRSDSTITVPFLKLMRVENFEKH